jgi:hypothetical protein
MDNRECAELEAELELRLNRYLMAKAFAERVGAVWPLDFRGGGGNGHVPCYCLLQPERVYCDRKTPELELSWTMLRACLLQAAVPVQVVEDCRKQACRPLPRATFRHSIGGVAGVR